MRVFEYTNIGTRKLNQDYLTHQELPDGSRVFVLCDGMGGYNNGDIAAHVVADSIVEYLQDHSNSSPDTILKESMYYANDCLMIRRLGLGGKMGCVVVSTIVTADKLYISWLGDSRAYVYRDAKELFVTTDHSMINELKAVRNLSPEDIEKYGSMVTRCIMGDDKMPKEIPVKVLDYQCNDILYMCSDGIHKEILIETLPESELELKEYLDSVQYRLSDNNTLLKVIL